MAGTRPPKLQGLMATIRRYLAAGLYWDTRHATDRQAERRIFRPEVLYVLKHGFHEKRKDCYEERFQAWNYAVRGETQDLRDLRVIVSFAKRNLLIITAIDLNEGDVK